jgi:hypothetical protein
MPNASFPIVNRWTVTYGESFIDEAAARFSVEREKGGGLTFVEFMAGPVRAARLMFEARWEQLTPQAGEAVRTAYVFSDNLGPVAFFGVLVGPRAVEIAGFTVDDESRGRLKLTHCPPVGTARCSTPTPATAAAATRQQRATTARPHAEGQGRGRARMADGVAAPSRCLRGLKLNPALNPNWTQ